MRGVVQILHFNDAYKATSSAGDGIVGGASRFYTLALKLAKDKDVFVSCGGDVFNPSLTSTVTKGKHVPPLLNGLGTKIATPGNHDLDFGYEQFARLRKLCNFPWVCSNLKLGDGPLGGCEEYKIVEINGVKVGFVGIAGTDFVKTLNFDATDLIVEEPVPCARRVGKLLRDLGCDTVVALTHMRMHEDVLIDAECPELDLILGGHDHEVYMQGKIAKGGCDWKHLVEAVYENGKWTAVLHDVTKDLEENPEISSIIESWEERVKKGFSKVLVKLPGPLDCRTALIRVQESPVANWIADMIKFEFEVILNKVVDAVLFNCGSIRGDCVNGQTFTLGDLVGMTPFIDLLLAYKASSEQLISGLEAGLSVFPGGNGGFPAICSGMHVEFDPDRASGSRITAFTINGVDLFQEKEREWVLVTKTYLADGKDGYDCWKGLEPIMDKECSILISSLIRCTIQKQESVKKMMPLAHRAFHRDKIRPKLDNRIVNTKPAAPAE